MNDRAPTEQENDRDEDEQPLVFASMQCTFDELVETVQLLNFASSSKPQLWLPPDVARKVAEFLTLSRVKPGQVQAVQCSSHEGSHPLHCCLQDDENTWWISKSGSMPHGMGEQWVEFVLSPTLCRLSSVSLKIPPLPQGPLSVREFRLDEPYVSNEKNPPVITSSAGDCSENGEFVTWRPISPTWHLDNRTGYQQFFLPREMDVQRIRLVCLSNQINHLLPRGAIESRFHDAMHQFSSVGFFTVLFQ